MSLATLLPPLLAAAAATAINVLIAEQLARHLAARRPRGASEPSLCP